MTKDPTTGLDLPDSAIQRITFLANDIHVYGIPSISSNKGFSASTWTSPTHPTAQQIFTARLRIIETSIDSILKVDIVLEDPNTGDLFAAAPYTSVAVVQQANDSSRFFAVRVQGEGGMKATLGIGFEERGVALDFNIGLGEARKVLGWEGAVVGQKGPSKNTLVDDVKQDFSLKEGEKIQVNVGSRGRRDGAATNGTSSQSDGAALFSIAPPPLSAKAHNDSPAIAPPSAVEKKSAQDFGFDDGEFGEFQ